MKLLTLLDHLAAVSGPAADGPRRAALARMGRAAASALPAVLATLPAVAATKNTSYDTVVQLLLLERTQQALYTQALAAPGLLPGALAPNFQRIQRQQNQHVTFLAQALQNAGAVLPTLPTFDFSGRRGVATNPVLFPNVLTSFDEFLALAQELEDLGVRLYKTQIGVINDSQLARAFLRIHAVEAQHSAHVRGLRRSRGVAVKNWPSETDAPIVRPAAAQVLTAAATGSENNTAQFLTVGTQLPFVAMLFLQDSGVRPTSLAEAFDEPVTGATAQAALNLFS